MSRAPTFSHVYLASILNLAMHDSARVLTVLCDSHRIMGERKARIDIIREEDPAILTVQMTGHLCQTMKRTVLPIGELFVWP